MPAPNRHLTTEPITGGDHEIAEKLATVSVPALIAAVVVMTGDRSYLRGPIKPREFLHNEFQGNLSDTEKAQLRGDALSAIRAWREDGCPVPAAPSDDVLREILDWIACEPVSDEYASLYIEEMDLTAANPRAIALEKPPRSGADVSVIVIGCGEAGLLAGIRMKEAGIPFEILEKNSDVGGTWLENSYPGCRVDVASHYYSYSFERNDFFTDYYTRQPELYDYFRALTDDHDIWPHISFEREVVRATWDDLAAKWTVTAWRPDGTEDVRTANALICGVGILNRPLIPDISGIDEFTGPLFHSARWDHSVDLKGKRIALLGAGASGFQIGPAIVDDVASLTVFQRTPQWMAPNSRYHAEVSAGERWAMNHLPGYSRFYRFMLMWQSSDKMLELVRADPDWPDFPRTANANSAARRDYFANWIEQQVGHDPVLAAKVTPDYPPMAKRMLQDNGSWLRCLTQSHVELVNDKITNIDADGVVTVTGRYDADVIVLATGFRAGEMLWPMEIIGRDGVSIADAWDGKPCAYNGVSVAGFPNFFIMAGPGTGLAHAGSVIIMSELEMRYIGDALRRLIDDGVCAIEPTTAAHDRYRDALLNEVSTLMWGHPSIEHSWYKSADGNVYILCPWRLVDYWNMTRGVDVDDHVIRARR
jgi:4-hydroxyacetophenone monooxygenase